MKPEQIAASKIWGEIAAARIISANHIEELIAKAFKGERARAKLQNRALNHLHAKSQEDCEVLFAEQLLTAGIVAKGESVTNLGEAYAESELAQKVIKALTADDETAIWLTTESKSCNASSNAIT